MSTTHLGAQKSPSPYADDFPRTLLSPKAPKIELTPNEQGLLVRSEKSHEQDAARSKEQGARNTCRPDTCRKYVSTTLNRIQHRFFRSSPIVPVLTFHPFLILLVIKAGLEFQLDKINQLGESILATPAISSGAMFFRTHKLLIAVGKQLPPKKSQSNFGVRSFRRLDRYVELTLLTTKSASHR